MDKIVIRDLEIYAYHGVLPEEKEKGQPFVVNVEMFLPLAAAGTSDDLNKTVNYADVCQLVEKVMLDEKYDLIEAAAENIASEILLNYDLVNKVHIVLSKPQAPIPMKFDTVCVDIERGRHIAYLGIGSNLGDKEAYLDYAVDQLNKDEYIRVNKVSTYIVTEPYGDVEQDDFLNGCLEIETLYRPQELLSVVNDIEAGAGRKRLVHWGPRTLDIDILLYDQEIIYEDNLIVPHVEMMKREFVLEPLAEIAPYVYHPGSKKMIIDLLWELRENERDKEG
ncbi:MAG: 2-amino-4-hydroxy-6-hydroxymethyldihydropteridine diphosphokinase [Lachnospiraceae bacterium]|nr:2-amino-4-hydroxy-6-hydroxymethyldihydropteridine diphosphokinase [Lachnospiraceae bacterium]